MIDSWFNNSTFPEEDGFQTFKGIPNVNEGTEKKLADHMGDAQLKSADCALTPKQVQRCPKFSTSSNRFNDKTDEQIQSVDKVQFEKRCESARLLINTGNLYREEKKYIEALNELEDSLKLTQQVWKEYENNPTEEKENANKTTVQVYQNTIAMLQCTALSSDAYLNMGRIYAQQKQFTLSEDKLMQAKLWRVKSIKFENKIQAENNMLSSRLKLSGILQEIGAVKGIRGDFRGSAAAYRKALKLRSDPSLDQTHPIVTTLLKALAESYTAGQNYTAVLKCFQMLAFQVGSKNLEGAELFTKISAVYCSMEKLDTAMRFAILAVKKTSRDDNVDDLINLLGKASAMEQVGNVYKAQIKLLDAIEWYKKAFSLRISALSEGHPLVTHSAIQIANVHRLRGEYEHAKSIYGEVMGNGIQHPSFSIILDKIGELFSEQKDYNAAIKHHMTAIRIRRKCLNVTVNPEIADGMSSIGLALLKKNRKREAMDHFTLALKMYRESHFCSYHPSVTRTIRNMTDFDHGEDDLETTSIFS